MSLSGIQFGSFERKTEKRVNHGAKSLLQNWLRHTTNHNRVLEETEMWQIHRRMKGESLSLENDGKRRRTTFRESKIKHSFLYDDRTEVHSSAGSSHQRKRAHMDEESSGQVLKQGSGTHDQYPSTYWQRQLLKAEENDNDRWGHGGFKELYPEDFGTDVSVEEGKAGGASSARKGKHKKEKDSNKRKKAKKRHKKKKKKRDKLQGAFESESDNDSVNSEDVLKRRRDKIKTKSDRHHLCSELRNRSFSKQICIYEKDRKILEKKIKLRTQLDCPRKSHFDTTSGSSTDSETEAESWKKRRRKW